MMCLICHNDADLLVTKLNVDYYQCYSCKTVFCGDIDNSNMVGGEFEQERNEKENHLRLKRVATMLEGAKKDEVNILDFGCGNGLLIKDLIQAGYTNVDGYDAYNPEYDRLPKRDHYHLVTAVEIFEHLSHPYFEIDLIHRCLKPGGAVMIETSFVDIADQENIPLKEFFYIAPQSGHSTIFSHHSLDLLMALRGFIPRKAFNRHVRLYQKPFAK